jgi:TldD protein
MCPDLPEADLIIGGSQLALQIHESVGHAIEFDRILGYEASFAGTSFLQPSDVGHRIYGAPIMNVTADATLPHGLGSFHYDDDGYLSVRDVIVDSGRLVGVLTSAGIAHVLDRRSNACMRAEGWNHFPIIRMTNVNLEPGEAGSLEDLIADTSHGYLLETNKSWSIDDKRLNFQFATELAVEIRDGKRGRLFRNPIYSGMTPAFWASCDAICGPSEWQLWGVTNCGKGEPMQVAQVSHGCAPARFRKQRLWGA